MNRHITLQTASTKNLLYINATTTVEQMKRLYDECFPGYEQDLQLYNHPESKLNQNKFLHLTQGKFCFAYWYLLFIDNELIGLLTAGLHEQTAHIYNGCVSSKYRGQKFGTMLYKLCLKHLKRLNVDTISFKLSNSNVLAKINKDKPIVTESNTGLITGKLDDLLDLVDI